MLTSRLGTVGLPGSGPRLKGRSHPPHLWLVLLELHGHWSVFHKWQIGEAQGDNGQHSWTYQVLWQPWSMVWCTRPN